MTLAGLVKIASNKTNFTALSDYIEFGQAFWDFTSVPGAIQAEIVSRNETQYRFLQFKEDGSFNVTRPLNFDLLYPGKTAKAQTKNFLAILDAIKASPKSAGTPANRELVNRAVYTIQQAIGASLDALPAGMSNTARKINGDLFERFRFLAASPALGRTHSGHADDWWDSPQPSAIPIPTTQHV